MAFERPEASDLGGWADAARRRGIEHLTVLAYRDLDDEAAGGSETHAHEVMAQWADAGLVVDARTVAAPGRPARAERSGYRVERRGGRLSGVPAIALQGAARRLPPTDAVVEIWNGLPFCAPLWWRGPRLIVLHHLHDKLWDSFFPSPISHVGSMLERRVAPRFYRSSPIATLAASGRDDLIARTPLRADQVHVVHPGVAETFRPSDEPGARSQTPLVVAVGRLTSAKRFDVLIQAVSGLVSEIPDLDLVIIGEGPERAELEALIDRLGLTDHVHLTGRVAGDDLLGWYRSAWCVASASISEGWGMTLTEAAACGTPAIATNIVGHRDALAVGAGLLVDSDLEFEAGMRKLLTNRAYRQMLQREATRAGDLTWTATAAHLLSLLVDDASQRR